MKNFFLIGILVLFSADFLGQTINAEQLLEKTIAFHDPNGNWPTFNSEFTVVMETPNSPNRSTQITINLPESYFKAMASKGDLTTIYTVNKGDCEVTVSKPEAEKPGCERANMYSNYYTYLYGLPMKLRDPGTIIDPKVERKTFKEKEYLVLKVTYSPEVGTDVWYFYFDPTTFAMEVYQFFKGDPSAAGKNTGEYILLSDLAVVNGIKMPKVRAWYYNKNDQYLGTDTLMD